MFKAQNLFRSLAFSLFLSFPLQAFQTVDPLGIRLSCGTRHFHGNWSWSLPSSFVERRDALHCSEFRVADIGIGWDLLVCPPLILRVDNHVGWILDGQMCETLEERHKDPFSCGIFSSRRARVRDHSDSGHLLTFDISLAYPCLCEGYGSFLPWIGYGARALLFRKKPGRFLQFSAENEGAGGMDKTCAHDIFRQRWTGPWIGAEFATPLTHQCDLSFFAAYYFFCWKGRRQSEIHLELIDEYDRATRYARGWKSDIQLNFVLPCCWTGSLVLSYEEWIARKSSLLCRDLTLIPLRVATKWHLATLSFRIERPF